MTTATKTTKQLSQPVIESQPDSARTHPTWSPGDVAHQGDLTFVCLATMPKSAKPRKDRQLADGNTVGSRHVLDGGKCFSVDGAEAVKAIKAATNGKIIVSDHKYIGPAFSGECRVTHPQHQHQVFPDNACTVVVFQRNMSAEETEQRAMD